MYNNLTIKELCEKIWRFEKEQNLLDIEIQGVRFWELIRFFVFLDLTEQLSGYGQAHSTKNHLTEKLTSTVRLLRNSITKNPFYGEYEVDFLIYDHARKFNVSGSNIDIYTDEFIKSQKGKKFDIVEAPYLRKHITSSVTKNRKYLDHDIVSGYFKKKLQPLKLDKEDVRKLKEVENRIKIFLNIDEINIYSLAINQIQIFNHKYEYHKKLFQKRKPKLIYVVVSYMKMPIIAAAKDLGIEVVEFQHGVITDYHFAYNYSDPSKKLKYFPDKLLTFGDYWARTTGFPKQTEIEVYGFAYLNQQIQRYEDIKKREKQVLFISQGTIGKELSRYANDIAKELPDYTFTFKLHPGEYDRWKNAYPDLVEASNLENFEVIDNNEKNLYCFFAESEYSIGVYSTALFEGLALDCKTIVFDLPGTEYINDLIEKDIVKLVHNKDEAIEYLRNFNSKKFKRSYFFKEKKEMGACK